MLLKLSSSPFYLVWFAVAQLIPMTQLAMFLYNNNPPHISFLLLQLKRVGLFNYFPQKYNFTLMTHYCANDTFESQFELCSLGLPTQTNQRLVRVQHLTF